MSILADGSVLQVNDGASNAYVDIPGVISFVPPESEFGEYDDTALDSTDGIMIKEPKSRAEPGTFSWVMKYSDTEYERLLALKGVKKSFKITYPDSSVDTIPAFIKKPERQEAQNQEPMRVTVTCQVTGLVVRT